MHEFDVILDNKIILVSYQSRGKKVFFLSHFIRVEVRFIPIITDELLFGKLFCHVLI